MFELWQLFRSRQAELAGQLRRLTDRMAGQAGAVDSAVVVVYREGDEDGDDNHMLGVWFTFADDPEHLYQATYDEGEQAFGELYS